MIRLSSLQQRLALFLLLPVGCLLFVMIAAGFLYARNSLIAQWQEVVVLRLGRAAHSVDTDGLSVQQVADKIIALLPQEADA